jgi:hypothetical protein
MLATYKRRHDNMKLHKSPDEFPIVPEQPPERAPDEMPVPDQDPGIGDPLPTEVPPIQEPPGFEPNGQ